MRDDLRAELLALVADDDTTRDRLARDGSLFDGYHPAIEAVHRRNAARLGAIVAAHGWPGRSLVGDDGVHAAWRIVQHAIGEPAVMRAMLPVLESAVAAGEARADFVAMLDDRIRVLEGRPQRFGTQYDWDDSATCMVPMGDIEDPATLDARRRALGLGPMEWSRPPDEPPPADIPAHRARMIAWARRVGWRQ
jgi:hypothetical protein